MTAEPLTPPQAEAMMLRVGRDLERARLALAQARDNEVTAKHDLGRARRKAILGRECPRVARGSVTVTERDAWVSKQTVDLEEALDRATVVRETAVDHWRTLAVQAELARSLSASVRTSLGLAGVAG